MHACIPPRAAEEGGDYFGIKSCLKAFHGWAEMELMQGIYLPRNINYLLRKAGKSDFYWFYYWHMLSSGKMSR